MAIKLSEIAARGGGGGGSVSWDFHAMNRDADGMISPLTDGIQLIEEMQAMIQDDSSQSVIA